MGIPVYMPPEQAQGKPVDARSDVYAIGSGLFHALTGKPPLNAMGNGDVHAMIGRLITGEIPRPREVNAAVPAALDAMCGKAMAFRPEDRYPTAAAFAADIRSFLAGHPVAALPRRGLWSRIIGRTDQQS